MRFVLFDEARLGCLEGDEVVDVSSLLPDSAWDRRDGPLAEVIESGAVETIRAALGMNALPRLPRSKVRLSAPLPRPGKVVGAPVNYEDHQHEMNEALTVAHLGVFLKAPTAVIGPGETVELPYLDKRVDQEGELGVVIGTRARDVCEADALSHVFGYTCVLDITVRSTEDRSTRKSFDTFAPIGAVVTTADEITDPNDLELRCWVNDELRQESSTKAMIYSVPRLIAYVSSVMTLEPGDVITTGTPAGVGTLQDGDRIRVEIGAVSTLEVGVSAANAVAYDARPGVHALLR